MRAIFAPQRFFFVTPVSRWNEWWMYLRSINNLKRFKDFRFEIDFSQGQNLASTGVYVPYRHVCQPLERVVDVPAFRAVQLSISEQLLSRNVERFRGGLVFKAHRLSYHSTLGSRVTKKKKKYLRSGEEETP